MIRKNERQPSRPGDAQRRIPQEKRVMAMQNLRLESLHVVGDQSWLRNSHGEIAAIEMLDGWQPQYMILRLGGAIKLRGHDPDLVASPAELGFIGADRSRDATNVRQIRIRKHQDFHGTISGALCGKWLTCTGDSLAVRFRRIGDRVSMFSIR